MRSEPGMDSEILEYKDRYCCIFLTTLAGSVVLIRKGVSKHHPYILEMNVRTHWLKNIYLQRNIVRM